MLKQGDSVEVNGVVSQIETSWAQGQHKVYRLSDGREFLDLDKSVANGSVRVVPLQRQVTTKPLYRSNDELRGSRNMQDPYNA